MHAAYVSGPSLQGGAVADPTALERPGLLSGVHNVCGALQLAHALPGRGAFFGHDLLLVDHQLVLHL
jgi:hypothetical protein